MLSKEDGNYSNQRAQFNKGIAISIGKLAPSMTELASLKKNITNAEFNKNSFRNSQKQENEPVRKNSRNDMSNISGKQKFYSEDQKEDLSLLRADNNRKIGKLLEPQGTKSIGLHSVEEIEINDYEKGTSEINDRKSESEFLTKKATTKLVSVQQQDISSKKKATFSELSAFHQVPVNQRVEIIEECRILSKEILNFQNIEKEKLIAVATRNQVLHMVDEGTHVDFTNPASIKTYMSTKGINFKEVYSLERLASGGEAIVYRADMKQPLEVVVKSVLPSKIKNQNSLASIITESHMIKLIEKKEYVVEIFEEIIEVEKQTGNILNYLVVVEQAIQDMKQLLGIWTNIEESILHKEILTPHKLFFFLYKAACALNNLHEQNIYYGDMKEHNLLIFRDYNVKLGDFGISLSLEDGDPDEKRYYLKGASHGYTIKEYLAQFKKGYKLSRRDLIKNDYYALFQTFNYIKQACKSYFRAEKRSYQEIFSKTQGDTRFHKEISFFLENFNYHLEDNSLFCSFLSEIEKLDPIQQNNPLADLLERQLEKLNMDCSFLPTLCHQLVVDEKYQAIPTALTLWWHNIIPLQIQRYFKSEEQNEFSFLTLQQTTPLVSDLPTIDSKILSLREDKVIELIARYISVRKVYLGDFIEILVELVNYQGNLSEQFYNKFYLKAFSHLFTLSLNGKEEHLFELLREEPELLKAVISSYNKKLNDSSLSKTLNLQHWEKYIRLVYFVSFACSTSTSLQDPIHGIAQEFFSSINFTSILNIIYENKEQHSNIKENFIRLVQVISSWRSILHMEQKDNKQFESFQKLCFSLQAKSMEYNYVLQFAKQVDHRVFLRSFIGIQKERAEEQKDFSSTQLSRSPSKRYLTFKDIASIIEKVEKASAFRMFTHSQTTKYIQNLQLEKLASPIDIDTIFAMIHRSMKIVYSELDNKMCQLNYKLYELSKARAGPGMVEEKALTLLIKVANYSPRRFRSKYMVELIYEYELRRRIQERDEMIEQCEELSPLLHKILQHGFQRQEAQPPVLSHLNQGLFKRFLNRTVEYSGICQLNMELLNTELLDIFRHIQNVNVHFLQILTSYFGLMDEEIETKGFDYLILVICARFIIPQLAEKYLNSQINNESPSPSGNIVTFEHTWGRLIIKIKFVCNTQIECRLNCFSFFRVKSFELHGKQMITKDQVQKEIQFVHGNQIMEPDSH